MPLSPILNYAIPLQNFEVVRDRIGEILAIEFENQHTNYSLPDEINPSGIDVERFIQIDEKEFPIIIVSLAKGGYDQKTYDGTARGEYGYLIDIYTGSASTIGEGGDVIASLNLHRMLGICRAILDDPKYKTLGFNPTSDGLQIQSVSVESIIIGQPSNPNNTIDFIWGRLQYKVTVPETCPLITPTNTAIGANITATLEDTGKFYRWVANS